MTPIEATAKKHCPILSSSPLNFPGLPNKAISLKTTSQDSPGREQKREG